jgi:glycosyltransferase involved in cell wall biosynthesis
MTEKRRRLLLLCYFYPPLGGGGVHRVLGFTRHLPRHGWDCTVICAGAEDYWVMDQSLLARVPPETEVIRVRGGSALASWLRVSRSGEAAPGRRPGGLFARLRRASDWLLLPDSYIGWARAAAGAARRRLARGDVDVLLSSSPPDSVHLAAAAAARGARIPWVADFRDPWVGLHFRRPPTAWHRARQQRLEREVLERADAVLAASRAHLDLIREVEAAGALRGVVARATHLPNGYEPEGAAADQAGGESIGAPSFLLVFTGTLALMPDTGVFLDALHDVLARHPEARRRLRVRLAGAYETGYRDRAVALGLTPGIVEFTGPIPHQQARALQRRADLLLLWRPRGQGYRTMVPGKLYEYLDAGRPLLALLPEGDEAAGLAHRGNARLLPPGERASLVAAIEECYLAWKRSGRAPDARPSWLEEHTRERLAGRLAEVLDRLAGERA